MSHFQLLVLGILVLALPAGWVYLFCRRQAQLRTLLEKRSHELSLSESAYRLLFEKNPCPILVYSLATRQVLTINPAFTRLLGYTEAEAVGQPIDLLTPEEQRLALHETITRISQQAHPAALSQARWRQRHKDGHEVELEIHSQNIDYRGERARIVMAQDITEREQFRSALECHHEQLEQLVEQRTAALHHAYQETEAAHHAKTAFLANMSHELRTPLNAVIGFSGLLERDNSLSPENRKMIATIRQAGQQLLGLINDVLEISGLEIRPGSEHSEIIALNDYLQEITAPFQHRATSRGLAFVLERDMAEAPWIEIDNRRLRHILSNLLGNAIKYTPHGRVVLHVSTKAGRLAFTVSDTGPGIPEEERGHIFEAFYQTTAGSKSGEGTGIGLYLSRQYARSMGGELSLQDQAGGGSCFVLDLPLHPAAAPSLLSPEPVLRPFREKSEATRLLVVDDQDDNRWLASQILEAAGFQVRCAENGQEAIDVFLAWHPHLICMDMRMPVLDGHEASRRIRALPGGNQVKIVAMTGNTLDEECQDILAAGCDAIITKPLDENQVFTTLRSVLRDEPASPGGAPSLMEHEKTASLSLLSPELRQTLAEAALRLDVDDCRQITARIHQDDPLLGQQLDTLLDSFRFDRLVDLCATKDSTGR